MCLLSTCRLSVLHLFLAPVGRNKVLRYLFWRFQCFVLCTVPIPLDDKIYVWFMSGISFYSFDDITVIVDSFFVFIFAWSYTLCCFTLLCGWLERCGSGRDAWVARWSICFADWFHRRSSACCFGRWLFCTVCLFILKVFVDLSYHGFCRSVRYCLLVWIVNKNVRYLRVRSCFANASIISKLVFCFRFLCIGVYYSE